AEAAINVAEIVAEERPWAYAVRGKANALYAMGQYRESIELHNRAIAVWEKLGESSELGRSLSVSILPLMFCGEYEAAFAAAERARQIFISAGDVLRLARLEINVVNVYYRHDLFSYVLAW